jgi:LCP family protein required for cell wall assembly
MNDWPEGWYSQNKPRRATGGMPDAPTNDLTARRPAGAGWSADPAGQASRAGRAGNWPSQPPNRAAPGYRSPEGPPGGFQLARRRRRFGPKRIFQIVAAVIILAIVAVVASYFYLDSKLNRSVTLPAFSGQSAGQNWLIAGSDSRQGLSRAQIDSLHVGFNAGSLNSDSLMLLHMGSGKPVLVSIPRDSYVPIPGHGTNKINAALAYGGPTLLIQTVESVTGLHIQHYMGIGFSGLVSVVNGVGGVKVCLPTALQDANSGVNLSAGCHNLNGTQALAFVRDRHSFANEDLQRIEDQRAFLKALLSKATSPGVYLNPFTAVPFASASASSLSVDQGTHLYNLISAAMALRNPQTGTVPIANANYLTANAGDAVLWNQGQAQQLFNALKNDQTVPAGLLTGTKVG